MLQRREGVKAKKKVFTFWRSVMTRSMERAIQWNIYRRRSRVL